MSYGQNDVVFAYLPYSLSPNLTKLPSNFRTIFVSPSRERITLVISEITFRPSEYVITVHRYRRTDGRTERTDDFPRQYCALRSIAR